MTNKEAIRQLQYLNGYIDLEDKEMSTPKRKNAIDLAISALERDGTLPYDGDTTSVVSCPVCGAIWRNK